VALLDVSGPELQIERSLGIDGAGHDQAVVAEDPVLRDATGIARTDPGHTYERV
jgi:hypothetical protein